MTGFVALSFLLLLIPNPSCQQDAGDDMNSKLSKVRLYVKSELIFLLDSSGSIGEADFDIQLFFVKSLLMEFSIGPNATRVAIVSYNEKVTRHIDYIVGQPDNKCNFLSQVKNIKYEGGSATNIEKALQEAGNIFENSRRSGQADVNKVLILLSDGVSNTGESPLTEAKVLREEGVEIYTIGVGLLDRSQLQLMASTTNHFFSFYNFDDFKILALRIRGDAKENQFDALVDQGFCDSLCAGHGCCHQNARCTCSLVGGRHDCVCGPGHFGLNGIQMCQECPRGTYKSTYAQVNECTSCPPKSTTSAKGSTSLAECECLKGYKGNPSTGNEPCKLKRCARLLPPTNGQTVPAICDNTYQSVCSFQCDLGYELVDPDAAERRCKADTYWSGTKAQCQKVRCADIARPTDGAMDCTGQEAGGRNVFGTTCRFVCEIGFNPVGNRERECTESGEWSGSPFSCKAITCPVLPPLSHGNIIPAKCGSNSKQLKVKLSCAFNCDANFRLQGPLYKQCLPSGDWSSDEPVTCVDDIPPKITCPDSIVKEAEPGLPSAEVTWDMPTVSDNLDGTDTLTVTVHPAGLKPPHRFGIGSVVVKYNVTDTGGSSAECYFKVVVQDTQPPTVENCPADEIDITSPKKMKAVDWVEPEFDDNSKEDLDITQSHEPGVELTWGVHTVTYTATDAAGSMTECQFRIRIGPTQCPHHPDPRNGARACDQWLFGTFCRVYCNQAFEFAEKPAAWYICGQGRWTTNPTGFSTPWPDCSEIYDPDGARLGMETQYYAGDCTNKKTQRAIKASFVNDFSKSMFGKAGGCMAANSCLVEEVTVYCGEIDEDRKRRRRRSPGTSELNYTVTIDFTVTTQIRSPDKEQHKAQLENATQTLEEIRGDFAKLAEAGQLHLVVDDQTLPAVEGSFSANQTVPLCRTGSMLLDTECINCAVGLYLDTAAHECRVCEEGTYQDEDGLDHCKTCPLGTWTTGTQAKDITECRTACNPGTSSPSGLSTCRPCPVGSYQHDFQQQACIPCREGTTTFAKGSRSSKNCRTVCSPGKFSVTGLRPCKPCPLGTYQPEQHQTECLPCPDSQMTAAEGATSESQCRDINACESAPCQNGGLCVRDGGSFRCECAPGFAGNTCEMEIDECASRPCFFLATCIDQADGFVCVCASGYGGALCDVETNECLSDPCQNEAKCRDQIASFECDCVDGFTGLLCETPPDHCASRPCLNGAICTQTPSMFRCQCQAGYQGARCQIEVDECYEKPCQNGASCIDLPGSYQCACVPGYEGVNCEVDINECLNHPCSNGATCRDVIDGYQCLCLPATSGRLCDTEMSQEFHLNFNTSSTSEFSLVEREISDFRAVTLSMWIRSSDATNMGTPFSYAAKRTANGSTDIVDNALTVTDCASLRIYVNGRVVYADAAVNTGYWTSLVFTWSSDVGEWSLYLNGSVAASGVGFSTEPIPGEGVFALGQEQDALGGSFSSRESYIGDIYKMNLWDEVLPESDISTISRNCFEGHGNLLAWSDFLAGLEGETLVPQPTDDGHEVPGCKSR